MAKSKNCKTFVGFLWVASFLGLGVLFAFLWDGTADKEIPLWINVGLCRNVHNATPNLYGSAQWLGPIELVAQGNYEDCKVPKPTYGLQSESKLAAKRLKKGLPYYPRIYATDLMNIKTMTITVKNDQTEVSQTWTFSMTDHKIEYFSIPVGQACTSHTQCISGACCITAYPGPCFPGKCVSKDLDETNRLVYKPFTKKGRLLEGAGHNMLRRRRLLKGGNSVPAAAPQVARYTSRHDPRDDAIESENALPYTTTAFGGVRRRIIDVCDAGMIFSIYSFTPLLGEREQANPSSHVDISQPGNILSAYKDKYNNIDACNNFIDGCDVKLFSSFTLFDLNGLGTFLTPEADAADTDTYTVSSTVVATYDESMAATSKVAKFTVEFPKIFVTFATEEEDPLAAVYGTFCILSFVSVFFWWCVGSCWVKKKEEKAYHEVRKKSHLGSCYHEMLHDRYMLYDRHIVKSIPQAKIATTELPDKLRKESHLGSCYNEMHSNRYVVKSITQAKYGITELPDKYRKLVDPFADVGTAKASWIAMDESDDDYTSLSELRHNIGRVNYLDITNNDIATIANLQAFPNLYHLNISNNNLKSVKGVRAANNLRKLEANDNYLTSLSGLNSTKIVSFSARRCDLISLQGCDSSSLQHLDCVDNDISSTNGISEFTTPLLRVVNLSNNDITDITSLCRFSYLEALCLSSNDIEDSSNIVNIINTCSKLKYVDVRNNDLEHLNGISSKSLEVLYASSNNITKLENMFAPALQSLDCTDNNINQIPGIGVSNTPMLETLHLGSNNLRDVSELCGLAHLEIVTLSDNELEDHRSIIEMVKTCSNLKVLSVSDNEVSKEIIEAETLNRGIAVR